MARVVASVNLPERGSRKPTSVAWRERSVGCCGALAISSSSNPLEDVEADQAAPLRLGARMGVRGHREVAGIPAAGAGVVVLDDEPDGASVAYLDARQIGAGPDPEDPLVPEAEPLHARRLLAFVLRPA